MGSPDRWHHPRLRRLRAASLPGSATKLWRRLRLGGVRPVECRAPAQRCRAPTNPANNWSNVMLETFSIRSKGRGRPPAGASADRCRLSAVPSAAGDSGGEMVDSVNKVCKLTPWLVTFPATQLFIYFSQKTPKASFDFDVGSQRRIIKINH